MYMMSACSALVDLSNTSIDAKPATKDLHPHVPREEPCNPN